MNTNPLTETQQNALRIVMDHTSMNPITGKDIANLIGLKPRKSGKEGADMRAVLNGLRSKGYPICATGNGYWWPRNVSEMDAYVKSFQGRIDAQQEACDGIRAGRGKVMAGSTFQEVVPARKIPVRFNNVVTLVPEDEVGLFIEMHEGAERL